MPGQVEGSVIQVTLGHDGVRWREGSAENRLLGGTVLLRQDGTCGMAKPDGVQAGPRARAF